MIQNYAMIDSSNIVYNVSIWDGNTSTWTPPTDTTCVAIGTERVGVGMTYNSSGVGIGTTSGNMWILDQNVELEWPNND
jgi:hypothetical protein